VIRPLKGLDRLNLGFGEVRDRSGLRCDQLICPFSYVLAADRIVNLTARRRHFVNRVAWLKEGEILGCPYPWSDEAFTVLSAEGVSVLVNLHKHPHQANQLSRHGMTQVHLPVADFMPPTPEQLTEGVAAIAEAVAAGKRVAVHCGAGLGRTGTLLACYLVHHGADAEAAVERVRTIRPGSVETAEQHQAVRDYALRLRG
jgi:atypical dual specificity phosphatase